MSPERDEALDQFLSRLRREAGLSLDQVCARTKIQARYVKALEEGHFGELPSNTHLRAFSIALTQACNGDEQQAVLLVRRVLNQVAAPEAQAPLEPAAPVKAASKAPAQPSAPPVPMTPVPVAYSAAVAVPQVDPLQAADGIVLGASQKLKALPWQAMLLLAGGAALLSGLLLWGVKQWQKPSAVEMPELTVAAETAPAVKAAGIAAAPAAGEAAPAIVVPVTKLVLRARRPCWLVLEIDGVRLPTVTMEDGDKLSWDVTKKAVLLAGNLGALRVWWNGDNLAYLGELGQRSNGLVFEPGKMPKTDKNASLPLPAGVPE